MARSPLRDRWHVARPASEMNRNRGTSPRRPHGLKRRRSDASAVRIHVGEDRRGATDRHAHRAGHIAPRCDDHLVAGSDTEHPQCRVQGERPIRHRQASATRMPSRPRLLEVATDRAGPVVCLARPQHRVDGVPFVVLEHRPWRKSETAHQEASSRSTRAGLPTATSFGARFETTTAPIPTVAPAPISVP